MLKSIRGASARAIINSSFTPFINKIKRLKDSLKLLFINSLIKYKF
jgi:hypothetical protein